MAGRPKKKASERRDSDIRIRVNEEERARFIRAATAKGLDFSAWARTTLLAAAPPEKSK